MPWNFSRTIKLNGSNIKFGNQPIESINTSKCNISTLYALLALTSFFIFLGGNLLLLNLNVLESSLKIYLICFGISSLIFNLSKVSKNLIFGVVSTYLYLFISVYVNILYLSYAILTISALISLRYFIGAITFDNFLASATCAVGILATKYIPTSFDMLNRAHSGYINQDTYFHVAISSILKTYQVISTGISGLNPISYHAFSHHLYAAISSISKTSVLEVYGVATWVLFAPLLMYGVVGAFVVIAQYKVERKTIALYWAVTGAILSLYPLTFYEKFATWNNYYTSESYLVAIPIFILGIALLMKEKYQISDFILLIFLCLELSFCKGSLGLIFCALSVSRLLTLNKKSLVNGIQVSLVSLSSTLIALTSLATSQRGAIKIEYFHFIKTESWLKEYFSIQNTPHGFAISILVICIFILMHFLPSWAAILHMRFINRSNLNYQEPILNFIGVSVFIGLVIVGLFNIPGGSAFYFTNINLFLVILYFYGLLHNKFILNSRIIIYILFLLILCFNFKNLYSLSFYNILNNGDRGNSRFINKNDAFIDTLLLVKDDDKSTYIYTPSSNLANHNPEKRCTAQPFVYPAISERVWFNVMNVDGSCRYINYGYENLNQKNSPIFYDKVDRNFQEKILEIKK